MTPLFVLIAVPLSCSDSGTGPRADRSRRAHRPACPVAPQLAQRRDRVGDSGLCRRPHRPGNQHQPQAETADLPCRARWPFSRPIHPPARSSTTTTGAVIWSGSFTPPLVSLSMAGPISTDEQLLDQFADTYQFKGALAADPAAMENQYRAGPRGFRPGHRFAEFFRLDRRLRGFPGRHSECASSRLSDGNRTTGYLGMQESTPLGAFCRLL